jgi:hypothetical protein
MDITYPLLIQEDIAQLQAAEKAARDKTRTDRVRMLRFLKEGRVAGVSQAAEIVDYSVRTVQRWWQCRGGSRASVRLRRSWTIVCAPFSAGGSAIAKAAWRRCWRRRSGAAWQNASRRKRGRACRRRCGPARSAGGASLSARHLAHRLRHRCPFQAVPAAQDQAERPHHRNSPAEQAAFKK